ncbi:hypothetical protein IWQ60_010768, partial [Tieghemiomyces parasiticus]
MQLVIATLVTVLASVTMVQVQALPSPPMLHRRGDLLAAAAAGYAAKHISEKA